MTLRRLRSERGMTLVELCVVLVIIGLLLVVAVTSLIHARMVANETSAIGALKTVNTAQVAYSAGCGSGNFASSLVVLGHRCRPAEQARAIISPDLSTNWRDQRAATT